MQKIIKETEHFTLVQLVMDVALDIYNNDKLNNFYIISKDYNSVETGTDSINMALYALYQAEEGYKEALAIHTSVTIPTEAKAPETDKKLN